MNNIKLKEYLSSGSLWEEIKLIEDFPFIGDDVQELDLIQKIEYGERIVFEPFLDVDLGTVAKLITKKFSDKWNILTKFQNEKDNINIFSDGDKISSTDVISSSDNTETSDVLNKVSSFNDDALIVDAGTSTENKYNKGNESKEVRKESKLNYNNLFNNLNSVEKSNIIDIVISDVSKYLTINNY